METAPFEERIDETLEIGPQLELTLSWQSSHPGGRRSRGYSLFLAFLAFIDSPTCMSLEPAVHSIFVADCRFACIPLSAAR